MNKASALRLIGSLFVFFGSLIVCRLILRWHDCRQALAARRRIYRRPRRYRNYDDYTETDRRYD